MPNSVAAQIAARHFGRKAVATLAKRGVRIIGLCVIPDMTKPLPFASGETGYSVDDNGTGRILSYFDVRRLTA
jgi:hypothetical protein